MRVLAMTLSLPGHYGAAVAILKTLQKAGSDVSFLFCSLPDYAVVPDTGLPSEVAEWALPEILQTPTQHPSNEQQMAAFAWYGEPLAVALETWCHHSGRPDVAIIDPVLWGAMTAAEALQLNWVSLATSPLFFRGNGVDVRGTGLVPAKTWGDRFRRRLLSWEAEKREKPKLDIINDLRRRRKLRSLQRAPDRYQRAPVTIATTAEPFEYPRRDWPTSLHFVGPLAWEEEFEEQYRPPSFREELPVVLVVDSSFMASPEHATWARTVCEALEAGPYNVIATLPSGGRSLPDGPNRRVVRSGPHSQMLPHVACVVCHGGPGIVQKALAHGVPVVAVPFALDRFEVARRLEVSMSGVALSPVSLTPARILSAVELALKRKAGATAIAVAFADAGGIGRATDIIQRMSRGLRTSSRDYKPRR